MREVRTIDDSSKSLESYFEAFSFTGSSTLNLEAEVETCLDRCRPVSFLNNIFFTIFPTFLSTIKLITNIQMYGNLERSKKSLYSHPGRAILRSSILITFNLITSPFFGYKLSQLALLPWLIISLHCMMMRSGTPQKLRPTAIMVHVIFTSSSSYILIFSLRSFNIFVFSGRISNP